MPKFEIVDTHKYLSEIFHVEANTAEEALDKYVNELAGAIESIDSSYEPEAPDGVQVVGWVCEKRVFETYEEAKEGAKAATKFYKKTKKQKESLRPYKCKNCKKFHLTKMNKHKYLYQTSEAYRKEINKKSFLSKESEYWKGKLGVDDD